MDTIAAGATAAGLALDAEQRRLLRLYFELLESAGKGLNLTAVHGWERVRDELFLRSLRFASVLPPETRTGRMVDVGTGAGIPGVVLKIAFPQVHMALVESSRKKAAFVSDAVERLGLCNVEVINTRAEDLARDPAHRAAYDIASARAVGSLAELAELLLPLVRVGGRAAVLKPRAIEHEAAEAVFAAREMGAAQAEITVVGEPGPGPADSLVLWRKTSPTPGRYPRRPGMPHKRPLRARDLHGSLRRAAAR